MCGSAAVIIGVKRGTSTIASTKRQILHYNENVLILYYTVLNIEINKNVEFGLLIAKLQSFSDRFYSEMT